MFLMHSAFLFYVNHPSPVIISISLVINYKMKSVALNIPSNSTFQEVVYAHAK